MERGVTGASTMLLGVIGFLGCTTVDGSEVGGLGAGVTGASAVEGTERSPHCHCCLATCHCEHHCGQETRVMYAASPAAPRLSGPARSPPVAGRQDGRYCL